MAANGHIPLINGRAYDWSMVEVKIASASIPFTAIESIEYEDESDIENNYGAGRMPTSRGFGNVEPTASIVLHMEEVVKLQDSIETGRLIDIPEFDIIIAYLHPSLAKITKDIIKNVKFKGNKRRLVQNDKKFLVELPLVPSHIEWGGTKFKPLYD